MKRSPEERKQYHIQCMGEKLGSFFNLLFNEFLMLYRTHHLYIELFDSDPYTRQLLNQADPSFFILVQKIMEDDILLHISRLTDESKGGNRGKYEYCTISSLPTLILKKELEGVEGKELNVKKKDAAKKNKPLKDYIKEAKKKAEPIRDHRHKRIAHTEFSPDSNDVIPPDTIFVADVKNAIYAIKDVLDYVSNRYLGSPMNIDTIPSLVSAIHLLDAIENGVNTMK